MVVKVASSIHQSFNENSENENSAKPLKLNRKAPAKLQRKSKILVSHSNSPSKTPLTSSSLVNINNASPLKHSQQIILPKTPIKTELRYEKCSLESPPSVSSSCSSSVSPNSNPEFQQESGTFISRSINTGDENSSCRNRLSPLSTTNNQQHKPPPLSRRNARERNRVKQVSMGFSLLRQHVPQVNRKKKLSKVETLRGAVDYIRGLEALLQEHPQPIVHVSQQKILPQKYLSEQGSNQFIQVSSQPSVGAGGVPLPSYTLQNLRGNPVSLQQEGQSSFYDDRIHQFQMPNSCLEPQILKVPKMEDQYHCTPVYSTSVYNIPPMSYCKNYDGSHTIDSLSPLQESKEYLGSPLQDSKDHLVAIVQGMQECPQSGLTTCVAKEPGEMELLEALAWWQHNS